MRDDGYTQPFAQLEPHEWFCGLREVLTHKRPGRATRYHVMVDDGMAACCPGPMRGQHGILLAEFTLIPIGDVPANMACQRNGCRQLFERFIQ